MTHLHLQVPSEEARETMSGEPYKIEILDDILAKDPSAPITIYHIGARPATPRLVLAVGLCRLLWAVA